MALRGRRLPPIPTPHPRARPSSHGSGPMAASQVVPVHWRPSKTRNGPDPWWSHTRPANGSHHPSPTPDVPARRVLRRLRSAMSARRPGSQPGVRSPIEPHATPTRNARVSSSGPGGSNNACNGNSRTGCGFSVSKPNWSAPVAWCRDSRVRCQPRNMWALNPTGRAGFFRRRPSRVPGRLGDHPPPVCRPPFRGDRPRRPSCPTSRHPAWQERVLHRCSRHPDRGWCRRRPA